MNGVGGTEHIGPPRSQQLGRAVVDVGTGVIADARMAAVVVLPAEELPAVSFGVLVATKVLVWNSVSSPPNRLRNNRFGARRAKGPSRSRTE